MSDIVERLEAIKFGLYWDVARDAMAEITRLRTLLSEADQREKDARRVALGDAASYHDHMAAHHAANHKHVVSDYHDMLEKTHVKSASDIRALQPEER